MGRKILFVTTDQQRYDTLGCNGGTDPYTATLDGTKSTSSSGEALTYSWAFVSKPAGSSATLANATTATKAMSMAMTLMASFMPSLAP